MRGGVNICSTNGFVSYFWTTKAVYPYDGSCSNEMRSGCTCVACDAFAVHFLCMLTCCQHFILFRGIHTGTQVKDRCPVMMNVFKHNYFSIEHLEKKSLKDSICQKLMSYAAYPTCGYCRVKYIRIDFVRCCMSYAGWRKLWIHSLN